jgi:hypothetical protein
MPLSQGRSLGKTAAALASLLAASLLSAPARAEWTWKLDDDDVLTLGLSGRLRGEAWESLTEHASGYYGLRVRPRLGWRHGDSVAVVAKQHGCSLPSSSMAFPRNESLAPMLGLEQAPSKEAFSAGSERAYWPPSCRPRPFSGSVL